MEVIVTTTASTRVSVLSRTSSSRISAASSAVKILAKSFTYGSFVAGYRASACAATPAGIIGRIVRLSAVNKKTGQETGQRETPFPRESIRRERRQGEPVVWPI